MAWPIWGSVLIWILVLMALGSACGPRINYIICNTLFKGGQGRARSMDVATLAPMATAKNVFILNSDDNKQEYFGVEIGPKDLFGLVCGLRRRGSTGGLSPCLGSRSGGGPSVS
jgi:hypothetical protein